MYFNYLVHYGMPRRSGRYPYGSGERPRQHANLMKEKGADRKKQLIKEQLGYNVNREVFLKTDPNASKSVFKNKGDKVYHVTPKNFNKLNKGQDLFISATTRDRNMYKSFLSLMMMHKGFKSIKEVEFTLKKDLKSPNNEDQKKIFNSVYNQNKKIFDDELNEYYKNGSTRPKEIYDSFIKTLDKSGESKRIFYKAIKSKGYNAVLDQHDVDGSWMQASSPLIVMDALSTIGDIKINKISKKDIEDSLKKLKVIK